jgi:hypothetical protein
MDRMPDRDAISTEPSDRDASRGSLSCGANGHHPEYLEIDTAQKKRWRGRVGYALLVLGVASLLVYLFMKFTGSIRLAIILVVFMMTYMAVMGWLASDQSDRRR